MSDKSGWELSADKFCLPLTLGSVNTEWYNWKLEYNKTNSINNSYKAAADAAGITYNINARAENFGKFNWDIDVKCFYATPNPDVPPYEYKVRTVDLANLFPNTSSSEGNANRSVTLESSVSNRKATVGENPGYNWTNAVASVKKDDTHGNNPKGNQYYPVDPIALISKIQGGQTGETTDAPTYSESNVDYRFVIGKKQFQTIREYYRDKKSNKYTTFSSEKGAFVGDETGDNILYRGIKSYRSPLITALGGRQRAIGCNNSENSSKCEVID